MFHVALLISCPKQIRRSATLNCCCKWDLLHMMLACRDLNNQCLAFMSRNQNRFLESQKKTNILWALSPNHFTLKSKLANLNSLEQEQQSFNLFHSLQVQMLDWQLAACLGFPTLCQFALRCMTTEMATKTK